MGKDKKRVRPGSATPDISDKSCVSPAEVHWIDALIHAGADVGETDKNGVTLLHHAVRFRRPDSVQSLIAMGADVNQACRRSGSTPLHRAVTSTGAPGTAGKQAEAREIVSLLLAAGADPAIKNRNGKIPSEYTTDETIRAQLAAKQKKV